MLLMTARPDALEGDEDDFQELVEFIGEELAEGMFSKADADTLVDLCLKIDPNCGDWLGM